jgi:hypothetical protein
MKRISSQPAPAVVAIGLFVAAALVGGTGSAVFGGTLVMGGLPAMVIVDAIAVALVVIASVFLGEQRRRTRLRG